jgi:glycosyltransferase involved in cell wall biosynthesis
MAAVEADRAVTAAASVSVVIPTRDRPRRTRAAIESALAQTLPPLEVIVVDDGSAEPAAFDHPQVRILRHGERRGAGAARNLGLDSALGDWAAFLDSDDRWLPAKLERQFERLEGAQALCCCNVFVLSADGATGRPYNRSAPSGDLSEWILIGGNTAQTSGLMLPTAEARRIRFDETLERHQDWDFFLRTAARLPLSYVQDPLVLYDGSPSGDRISRGSTAAGTLAWIDLPTVRPLVSERARHEWLCRQAAAPGLAARPLAGFAALARALSRGELRPGPTLGWLGRAFERRLRAGPAGAPD